jgi:hypothetical protein
MSQTHATAGRTASTIASTEGRGSIPPGTSRDESLPAEGAIKGGSIEPDIISTSPTPQRDINRCKQLTGELQEQCLRDLGASSGSSVPSAPAPPSLVRRDPVPSRRRRTRASRDELRNAEPTARRRGGFRRKA